MGGVMEIVKLTKENIEKEHICCAISDKKSAQGYQSKKDYLKNEFENSYVFKKYDVNHKVFIEYVPVEKSWGQINAAGYMLINCFWVAGSYKGKGYGKKLLAECLNDSKDMNGVVVVSSDKKRPFLADKKFFTLQGFEVCDKAPPYFELLVKKNKADAPNPKFTDLAKKNTSDNQNGLTIYYTNQCPFTEYYVNEELKSIADFYNIPLKIIRITSQEQAKNIPSAFSIYNLFYNGRFVTHEILTKKRFDKIWEKELKMW